jgi:predicted nucleic acid-binding protein
LTLTFFWKSSFQSKKDECEALLEQFRTGKETGIVTDFSIHSIMVIMSSLGRFDGFKIFLASLRAYKGLRILQTKISTEIKAAEIASQGNLDMDDALQYAAALDAKAEAIVSFDKHFGNLKIPKKEPHQII